MAAKISTADVHLCFRLILLKVMGFFLFLFIYLVWRICIFLTSLQLGEGQKVLGWSIGGETWDRKQKSDKFVTKFLHCSGQ